MTMLRHAIMIRTVEEKEFSNNSLKIVLRTAESGVELVWSGKNTEMDAGKFIAPILQETLEKAANGQKPIRVDFQALEFMNSSTISQLIIMLNNARDNDHRLELIYREASKWQRFSFSALDVFQTPDKRIHIRGV